jgi:hypothetical protein
MSRKRDIGPRNATGMSHLFWINPGSGGERGGSGAESGRRENKGLRGNRGDLREIVCLMTHQSDEDLAGEVEKRYIGIVDVAKTRHSVNSRVACNVIRSRIFGQSSRT